MRGFPVVIFDDQRGHFLAGLANLSGSARCQRFHDCFFWRVQKLLALPNLPLDGAWQYGKNDLRRNSVVANNI